jgi:ABC-2 type transport system ATP-binding protein
MTENCPVTLNQQPRQGGDDAEAAVVVQELTKQFGAFTAVDHATFEVQAGTIFGFLGPNGAGKTTTIRMLLGLLKPTAGTALILGYDVTHEAQAMRRHIGYMSQKFSLYSDLTVEENLTFYGRVYGLHGANLARRKAFAMEMAGLEGQGHAFTKDLAGGWKQRLALGCAILHQPRLLFLDEPTAGVDPISRRAFWNLLYSLSAQGTTIFVTTHYMDEAERCQDLAFILDGRIIAQGTPQEIKRTKMRGQVLEVNCSDARRALSILRDMAYFDEVALYGSRIHLVAAQATDYIPEVKAQLQAADLHVQGVDEVLPSLEDVFISQVRARIARSEET